MGQTVTVSNSDSLERAIRSSSSGDTIIVKAGRYDRFSVSRKQGLIVVAEDGVVVSDGSYSGKPGITIDESTDITIDGFTVQKSRSGIWVQDDSSNIVIQNNTFRDIGQEAIHIVPTSRNVEILRNTIRDTGKRIDRYGEGIYVGTGVGDNDSADKRRALSKLGIHNVKIIGNDIRQTSAEAIDVKKNVHNVLIERNTISDIRSVNGGAIYLSQGRDANLDAIRDAENIVVRDNSITNIDSGLQSEKYGTAIVVQGAATIENNTIRNTEHRGIFIRPRIAKSAEVKLIGNDIQSSRGKSIDIGAEANLSIDKTPSPDSISGDVDDTSDNGAKVDSPSLESAPSTDAEVDRPTTVTPSIQKHDRLIGANPNAEAPGRGQRHTLVGTDGANLFQLGDRRTVYYDDGYSWNNGDDDYALIQNFNRQDGDAIQLNGSGSDYRLGEVPDDTPDGTGIFLEDGNKDELVGIVANASDLSLDSDAFVFVA